MTPLARFRQAALCAVATALCSLAAPAAADQLEMVTAGAGFGAAGLGRCNSDLRILNQIFGWQSDWPGEWAALRAASDEDIRAAISRWHLAPHALDSDEAYLAATLAAGGQAAAPRIVVQRVLTEVDDLSRTLHAGPPPLRDDAPPALREAWRALFAEQIVPKIDQYRTFLRNTYLPEANHSAGLSGTPNGPGCFRNAVRYFTSVDMPPARIEALGRRLLAETDAQLERLYNIRPAALPALLERLRGMHEPGFDAARLTALSTAAIARAEAAMPRMFLSPSHHPVIVQALPRAAEASAPAGFYQPGDGTTPAAYVINLSRPAERRLMAEVIAFHETMPGHHAAFALDLPPGQFNSGFLEGWALYSEFVADEMGLYSGQIDRAGMMAKHLWAASRLVVEPGLHLHGWTRDQAIAFMRTHTALTQAEIEVEVDRYIATPGQSLSYMIGYDMIARARRYAERRLGSRFDLRRFHQMVLGAGSRPLARMYADVVRWADRGGA